ncbi:hypothetical protein Q7P36_000896 [Cladosporium allicinum]
MTKQKRSRYHHHHEKPTITTAAMQTIIDVVIIEVLLFALCFFILARQQPKAAAPRSSVSSAAALDLDLTLPALSLSALALPATEAYLASSSASPPVGTCRLHPLIEEKLPLSPKAVEPSYEEWVPQDPPQRPGNGLLVPKSQPRLRRAPAAKPRAARMRPGADLVLAPVKPWKPRWSGRLARPAGIAASTSATLDGKDKTGGVGSSVAKAVKAAKAALDARIMAAEEALYTPPNPLFEVDNAAADDQVIEWLKILLAPTEPLLDRYRRDTTTIPNIVLALKF